MAMSQRLLSGLRSMETSSEFLLVSAKRHVFPATLSNKGNLEAHAEGGRFSLAATKPSQRLSSNKGPPTSQGQPSSSSTATLHPLGSGPWGPHPSATGLSEPARPSHHRLPPDFYQSTPQSFTRNSRNYSASFSPSARVPPLTWPRSSIASAPDKCPNSSWGPLSTMT